MRQKLLGFLSAAACRHFSSSLAKGVSGAQVSLLDRYLTLKSGKQELKFHYLWLRDHSPQSLDPSSGQKLHSSSDIPVHIKPANVQLDSNTNSLKIDWSDSHRSSFPLDWLKEHSYPLSHERKFPSSSRPKLWMNKDLPNVDVSYEDYMNQNNKGLKECLNHLHEYGISFIRGVPTNDQEVLQVGQRIGLIYDTFYGKSWDVKSVPQAKNIAYTPLPLHFHQDLLYFEAPPGLQLLHSLKNSCTGGETLFMDGFKAAEILRETDYKAFEILAKVPVTFHYRNGDHHYHLRHPTIKIDLENEFMGIYFSPQFQGPLDVPLDQVESFYASFNKFSEIVNREEMILTTKLMPGDLVIFNNRRTLHARKYFDPNSGERHLKGTYIHLDDFRSKWRTFYGKKS